MEAISSGVSNLYFSGLTQSGMPSVPSFMSPAAPAAPAGGTAVKASVPGKILRLEKNIGDTVAAGDTVLILEAMKMEIPVVAPEGGTIQSFQVSVGDAVESGDVLTTLS